MLKSIYGNKCFSISRNVYECWSLHLPLSETTQIITYTLSDESITIWSKQKTVEFLFKCCYKTVFTFDNQLHTQIDGVTNTFLCLHERNWLNNSPVNFKPVFYERYIDGNIHIQTNAHSVTKISRFCPQHRTDSTFSSPNLFTSKRWIQS